MNQHTPPIHQAPTLAADIKPPRRQFSASWRCGGTPVVPPPSQAEALQLLTRITQCMFHQDPDLSTQNDELLSLQAGATTTAVIASLSTTRQFNQIVWETAVGAAFDFCAELLGIADADGIDDYRQGFVCDYWAAYCACTPQDQGSLNLGWMIASLVSDCKPWIELDKTCNYIPDPLDSDDHPIPCPNPIPK
jgi:hypothetical protein